MIEWVREAGQIPDVVIGQRRVFAARVGELRDPAAIVVLILGGVADLVARLQELAGEVEVSLRLPAQGVGHLRDLSHRIDGELRPSAIGIALFVRLAGGVVADQDAALHARAHALKHLFHQASPIDVEAVGDRADAAACGGLHRGADIGVLLQNAAGRVVSPGFPRVAAFGMEQPAHLVVIRIGRAAEGIGGHVGMAVVVVRLLRRAQGRGHARHAAVRIIAERRHPIEGVRNRFQQAGGRVVAERGRLRERVGDGEEMAVGGVIGDVGRVVALVGELRERVEGGLIGVAARGVAGQRFEGDVAQTVARVAGGVVRSYLETGPNTLFPAPYSRSGTAPDS